MLKINKDTKRFIFRHPVLAMKTFLFVSEAIYFLTENGVKTREDRNGIIERWAYRCCKIGIDEKLEEKEIIEEVINFEAFKTWFITNA